MDEIDRRKELLEQHYTAYKAWAADPSVENAEALARIEAKLEGMND